MLLLWQMNRMVQTIPLNPILRLNPSICAILFVHAIHHLIDIVYYNIVNVEP